MRHGRLIGIALTGLFLLTGGSAVAVSPEVKCLAASGGAGVRCLKRYAKPIEKCRSKADAACEDEARAEGGILERRLAETEAPIQAHCTQEIGETLGYLGTDDVAFRIPEACMDFAEDLLDIVFADDPSALSPDELSCQRTVARKIPRLRQKVIKQFGAKCFVPVYAGGSCDRAKRDARVASTRAKVHGQILRRCGSNFDALGLSTLGGGSTLEERIDEVLDLVINRSRHFAQRVYPPNDLGPTADFGPFPVGITTLNLVDSARMDVTETGPRPVTTEVYYPSTAAAVDGVPRDIAEVLGVPVAETPAFRDVALASGTYPLVVFSHGNNGIRIQSFFFAAHLASHGFIVATPDHHGNTFVDGLLGLVDTNSIVNRPLDMTFLIDEMLFFNTDSGNFFEGAIDPSKIGMSGHSFGGYTTFALAGGTFVLGTFTDARVKAIFPQAPSAAAFDDSFFNTITIPTLIIGGSIDETTPFPTDQQRPFDNLPSGAAVVAVAKIADGGHFTFSDFCEVPRDLLGFLGGFDEACLPRHLPWRHAHDITNFLSLNFFDGILNGNADALDRLDPTDLATIEDLTYQSK
jgi:predicted dienelactone hydrolase